MSERKARAMVHLRMMIVAQKFPNKFLRRLADILGSIGFVILGN